MKNPKTISDQLRQAITDSGLTHYAIAKLAGTVPHVIDRFMEGRDLRGESIAKIGRALGLRMTVWKIDLALKDENVPPSIKAFATAVEAFGDRPTKGSLATLVTSAKRICKEFEIAGEYESIVRLVYLHGSRATGQKDFALRQELIGEVDVLSEALLAGVPREFTNPRSESK